MPLIHTSNTHTRHCHRGKKMDTKNFFGNWKTMTPESLHNFIFKKVNKNESDAQVKALSRFNIFEDFNHWCGDCNDYNYRKKHFTCCGDPLCVDCIVPVIIAYLKEVDEY